MQIDVLSRFLKPRRRKDEFSGNLLIEKCWRQSQKSMPSGVLTFQSNSV